MTAANHGLFSSRIRLANIEHLADLSDQATAADELRAAVAFMEKDAREAADLHTSLRKALTDQEENERQSTEKVRRCGM